MSKRLFLTILSVGFMLNAISQNRIVLTFTAVDNAVYVQLDSVKIMNRTKGGETVLFWPDAVLMIIMDIQFYQ